MGEIRLSDKMNEFSFIEYLRKKIPKSGRVSAGIGDDAAVLNVSKGKQLVVSTDVIVENVDFVLCHPREGGDPVRGFPTCPRQAFGNDNLLGVLSPEKIGRKALAVNLSDIAAMGATPTAFVISVGKPPYVSPPWLKRFYKGLLALAKQYNVTCIGGDFSRSKEFFASVTILGEVAPDQVVTRSGATAGDWIAVTGRLGGSLLRHHHDFTPRVREGLFLVKHVTPTAMIDISDGLVQDLSHILKASKVGAALDLDKIPVSSDAKKLAKGSCCKALERALADGEDFELLFTVPPWHKMMLEKSWKKSFPRVPLTWIGKIEGKKPVIRWTSMGKSIAAPKLTRKGFSHF
ncbi:MAG: thiamine-phosphate kinase [Candidatus Omnitrophota bacterium]